MFFFTDKILNTKRKQDQKRKEIHKELSTQLTHLIKINNEVSTNSNAKFCEDSTEIINTAKTLLEQPLRKNNFIIQTFDGKSSFNIKNLH